MGVMSHVGWDYTNASKHLVIDQIRLYTIKSSCLSDLSIKSFICVFF